MVERGTVQAVAVDLDSMSNDSAVVLIASTSEVTNAAGAKQDPRTFKLIVTLTRDGASAQDVESRVCVVTTDETSSADESAAVDPMEHIEAATRMPR